MGAGSSAAAQQVKDASPEQLADMIKLLPAEDQAKVKAAMQDNKSITYDKAPEVESKHFPEFRATLPRMEGKVVAVTGCTSGTGLVCARVCAELGAQVIMLNRSSERADKALQVVQKAAPEAKVSLVPCDLMSFDSVREAAKQLSGDLAETGLDLLCNNAGIMATRDEATKDGCDTQMQTNHLSHFLLTAEVWALLEKAAELRGEARVVNHSSMARFGSPLEQKYLEKNGGNLGGDDAPAEDQPFTGPRWIRYHHSKLANMVFTYALRDRTTKAGSKVKALVAHPGLAATNLQVSTAHSGGMDHQFTQGFMGRAQSMEDGACGIIRASCAAEVQNGDFFGPTAGYGGPADLLDQKPEEERADEGSRKMLWEVSTEITGGNFPDSLNA